MIGCKKTIKKKVAVSDPGWDAVKMIYFRRNLRTSICPPFCASLVFTIYSFLEYESIVNVIQFISNLILQILPGVLGFILAGYALMMGLSSSDYIKKLKSKKVKNYDHSMFQTLNSTFAFVLFILFVTLLIGVISSIIIFLECSFFDFIPEILGRVMNAAFLFLVNFLLLYSIIAIKDIIINVFNFGQFVQAYKEDQAEIK